MTNFYFKSCPIIPYILSNPNEIKLEISSSRSHRTNTSSRRLNSTPLNGSLRKLNNSYKLMKIKAYILKLMRNKTHIKRKVHNFINATLKKKEKNKVTSNRQPNVPPSLGKNQKEPNLKSVN